MNHLSSTLRLLPRTIDIEDPGTIPGESYITGVSPYPHRNRRNERPPTAPIALSHHPLVIITTRQQLTRVHTLSDMDGYRAAQRALLRAQMR
jgi:hypothetical protein